MLGTRSNITLKIAHHSLQICAFAIFGSWGYFEEVRTAGANSAALSTNVFLTTTTYMLCISLTANPSPREVCQNTGEIPDSAARSLPIPFRVILSSPVAAANPASWTELLLGLLPAEAWQKLVAPPTGTFNFRFRGCNVPPGWVGNGVLITHPCSQVRSQQFFVGLSLLLLGWVSSVKSPGITSTDRLLILITEGRGLIGTHPRAVEKWFGNIGGSQKLKEGRKKRIRIFSAERRICHLSLLELVLYFWIELYVFNSSSEVFYSSFFIWMN